MTYTDADGNVLTKTALLALTTTESGEVIHTFTADVHQLRTMHPEESSSQFEGEDVLLYHAGQKVPESELNALFEAATVTSITPNSGPAAGGTVVTIDGTNLAGVSGVTFGGTAGTAFTRVSDTRVKVTTPAHATGAVAVVTKDDNADVTTANGFTYV